LVTQPLYRHLMGDFRHIMGDIQAMDTKTIFRELIRTTPQYKDMRGHNWTQLKRGSFISGNFQQELGKTCSYQ
jgi:hypothetical protein